MEDKNFKIMTAMNYGYDNPESREMIKPDEEIIEVAKKNSLSMTDIERICLYASMSSEPGTLAKANEYLKAEMSAKQKTI